MFSPSRILKSETSPCLAFGNTLICSRIVMMLFIFFPVITFAQATIAFDTLSQPQVFGVKLLIEALRKSGTGLKRMKNVSGRADADINIKIANDPALKKEGYKISRQNKKIIVTAVDQAGGMYGAMDLAEQIDMGKSLQKITDKIENPRLSIRAIKFNLPWSSYRVGPAMQQHMEVCRDLSFWQSFLDQMASNRFNVLSLWNVHPFSYMVQPVNFPGASRFSAHEMAGWKHFWTSLFKMAKDRGIETFIVNWNIAVSPEFAEQYNVKERNDTSAIVRRYTREVVTQVINEYPDLSGIGITLADWMSNFRSPHSSLPEMSPKDREDWVEETVVAGIREAQRPVKFLHRSVLSSDPKEMRRVIDNARLPDTTLVEIKFNWSHGHSTPLLALTHDVHSGKVDNGYWSPMPENYRIQWMIRNEDVFILRWGQPEFIRKHIARNTQPYVNGYFVGSEGYIPANDFSHKANTHRTWTYAFEKQWLFYMVWGRLLFNPSTPDATFEAAFEKRYGKGIGKSLLKACALGSKMPLRLASFHGATWDYTLYSEGFLAPFPSNGGLSDDVSSFISIDELIDHPVLDPRYFSIKDYVRILTERKSLAGDKITPLVLADSLERDGREAMKLVNQMRTRSSSASALSCELDDLETWVYLSHYFAEKLRAGVALETFRITKDKTHQQRAIQLLSDCLNHWKKISDITASHYKEVPYVDNPSSASRPDNDARQFSWSKYLPQVERDIKLATQTGTNN